MNLHLFLLALVSFSFRNVASFLRGGGIDDIIPPSTTTWRTAKNQVIYQNKTFYVKGINWNGIESDCRVVHGLWANTMDFYLDILQSHQFNVLRIPIPYEVMLNMNQTIKPDCIGQEAYYEGKTVYQFLDDFLYRTSSRGIFVLFDLHTIGGLITPYPWTDAVTEASVMSAWVAFATEFATRDNVMGLEIKNEPHGDCTNHVFQAHCARVIQAIQKAVPKYQGLFFIDGVSFSGYDQNSPWGGTLQGSEFWPTNIEGLNHPNDVSDIIHHDRIVFCPHVYGPDVRHDDANRDGWADHERRYGFITSLKNVWKDSPIIPTEFGGFMRAGTPDLLYFQNWAQFQKFKNLTAGGMLWTFPETSADTGGLIMGENWRDIDQTKLTFMGNLVPAPTMIKIN